VVNPGVHLLPAGSTITDIIEAAGGMTEGHVFKAYQPGGPSSGLLPASLMTFRLILIHCNRLAPLLDRPLWLCCRIMIGCGTRR